MHLLFPEPNINIISKYSIHTRTQLIWANAFCIVYRGFFFVFVQNLLISDKLIYSNSNTNCFHFIKFAIRFRLCILADITISCAREIRERCCCAHMAYGIDRAWPIDCHVQGKSAKCLQCTCTPTHMHAWIYTYIYFTNLPKSDHDRDWKGRGRKREEAGEKIGKKYNNKNSNAAVFSNAEISTRQGTCVGGTAETEGSLARGGAGDATAFALTLTLSRSRSVNGIWRARWFQLHLNYHQAGTVGKGARLCAVRKAGHNSIR